MFGSTLGRRILAAGIMFISVLLTGCGGGGSSTPAPITTNPALAAAQASVAATRSVRVQQLLAFLLTQAAQTGTTRSRQQAPLGPVFGIYYRVSLTSLTNGTISVFSDAAGTQAAGSITFSISGTSPQTLSFTATGVKGENGSGSITVGTGGILQTLNDTLTDVFGNSATAQLATSTSRVFGGTVVSTVPGLGAVSTSVTQGTDGSFHGTVSGTNLSGSVNLAPDGSGSSTVTDSGSQVSGTTSANGATSVQGSGVNLSIGDVDQQNPAGITGGSTTTSTTGTSTTGTTTSSGTTTAGTTTSSQTTTTAGTTTVGTTTAGTTTSGQTTGGGTGVVTTAARVYGTSNTLPSGTAPAPTVPSTPVTASNSRIQFTVGTASPAIDILFGFPAPNNSYYFDAAVGATSTGQSGPQQYTVEGNLTGIPAGTYVVQVVAKTGSPGSTVLSSPATISVIIPSTGGTTTGTTTTGTTTTGTTTTGTTTSQTTGGPTSFHVSQTVTGIPRSEMVVVEPTSNKTYIFSEEEQSGPGIAFLPAESIDSAGQVVHTFNIGAVANGWIGQVGVNSAAGRLYVPSQHNLSVGSPSLNPGGTIQIVDTATDTVIQGVPVTYNLFGTIYNPINHELYVFGDNNGYSLNVYDASSDNLALLGSVSLAGTGLGPLLNGLGLPSGAALDPGTNRLYAVGESSTIAVFDTSSSVPTFRDSIAVLPPGQGVIGSVAVDTSTHIIYAAYFNNGGDDFIAAVNGVTEQVVGVTHLGSGRVGEPPYGIAVNSNTHQVFCVFGGSVAILSPATTTAPPAVVSTLNVTDQPIGVAVNPNTGTAYAAARTAVSVVTPG